MKTKLLYVAVSSDKDIYLEQAYVSMFSAKFYMPDAKITLLTDKMTADSFTGVRKEFVKYVDELVVVPLDSQKYNAQKRSRLLKTNARNHVEGDYLFIDSDTIVTRPFYDVDEITYEIAACWDTHSPAKTSPFYYMTLRDGRKLNWPVENEEHYFNSGVIYVKDTPLAHQFYALWNKNLQDGYPAGVTMDQPAFAKTNYMMGHVIGTLHDTWNCELKYGVRWLKDARIVHYLTTNKSKNKGEQFFILNKAEILEGLKVDPEIPAELIEVIKDPFKGIANVTHCFAGEDVMFFSSVLFDYTRSIYGTRTQRFYELLIRAFSKIKRTIKFW